LSIGFKNTMYFYNKNGENSIPIPSELSQIADNRLDVLHKTAEDQSISLPQDPAFVSELRQVFMFSDFIFKSCSRDPAMLLGLYQSGDLQKSNDDYDYEARLKNRLANSTLTQPHDLDVAGRKHDKARLQQILRKFRSREMVRIAWRDLTGSADLEETIQGLSTFAEICIDRALQYLYTLQCMENGIPTSVDGRQQQLVVIGMGKLGGNELNFSSDIDLIFAYAEAGSTDHPSKPISNVDFFVKLCRDLVKTLSEFTPDGHVFRVDTRLRPDGDNGPLVMSFDNMEEYYQVLGREWERYAWIKARGVAGDKIGAENLLARLNPFIYRRYLDYGVFESIRKMKEQISLEVRRKGLENNVKLGPGGIREIEFFGQIFQLLRGGVTPALQDRRILKILNTLRKENMIDQNTCDSLSAAYIFLRHVEHRLQEFSDQQTHALPTKDTEKMRLSLSMGFPDWKSFALQLRQHTDHVHAQFNTLLETADQKKSTPEDNNSSNALTRLWIDPSVKENALTTLSDAGFEKPGEVLRLLDQFKDSPKTRALSQIGRNRIDRLIPLVIEAVSVSSSPDMALKRILQLIDTIQRRTTYIALLLENPNALQHLIRLANASSWIVSFLAQHPVLLDELIDPRTLYSPPEKTFLQADLRHRLEKISADDLEYQMEEMCIFKQVNTLRVAAADITDTLPLMKVSDYLSDIAETTLDSTIKISWDHLTAKHGSPSAKLNGQVCEKGFAVIAYGKLGGLELGYGSDLDMVFIHCGTSGQTNGKTPIDNSQFFARLGQRVIHTLSTHTAAGKIYEIDMRLRPSGSSGILVSHFASYQEYQTQDAWTWEHQALLRARAIIGDEHMTHWFNRTRKEILTRPRKKKSLQEDVRNMREKMRNALLKSRPDTFDVKQDRGGMVDIEFLVQYLVLLHAHRYPELVTYSDNVRQIQALAETGILEENTAHSLRRAYLVYRATTHRLDLREQSAKVTGDTFKRVRNYVQVMWNFFMAN
jgi:glutamate-ammonia-ligase adenylyltransferase